VHRIDMSGAEILDLLASRRREITRQFGVRRLALFGSVARGEATPASDVDVLVEFSGPADSRRYFGLQFYIEDLVSRPVNLVTTKGLRAELRPVIEGNAVDV
jgi:hypothetical protein